MEKGMEKVDGKERIGRKRGATSLESLILDWLPSHDKYVCATIRPLNSSLRDMGFTWGRAIPDFHRSLLLPLDENGSPCASVSSALYGVSHGSFLECQPQRGMPSTRALLTTNHSIAGRSGSAFQVRYPNRLLSNRGQWNRPYPVCWFQDRFHLSLLHREPGPFLLSTPLPCSSVPYCSSPSL